VCGGTDNSNIVRVREVEEGGGTVVDVFTVHRNCDEFYCQNTIPVPNVPVARLSAPVLNANKLHPPFTEPPPQRVSASV
jgi:hypothetical protein